MARLDVTGEHWLWQGPLDRDGYGLFWFRRKGRRPHRLSYWASVGDIPAGFVVDHIREICALPACVRPEHLRALTVRENTLLGDGRSAVNARKTRCPRGHPYDRVYGVKRGPQRYCSVCEAAKRKRLRAKWAADDTVGC